MISILAVIYIVFISLGLPDSVFGVSWPVVHLDLGVNESFASLYSIITGICSGSVSFFAGVVLRKFGTPKVTAVSILLTVIGLVGISFSPNILIMMAFAIILGCGAGAIDTGLNNYVSNHYEARHMSWLHCFWGIGVTASPIIMAQFLSEETSSWRNGYRTIAFMQVLILLIVIFSLKKWNREDKKSTAAYEESSKEKGKMPYMKGLLPSILSLGFYCAMEFTVGTWGATYIVNTCALSPDTAARWVSFYYGGIMLGRLVSGFISMKLSDNKLIRSGLVIALIGLIILLLPLGTNSLLGLLLIGFGFGPIFPSVLHAVPERFGSAFSADITGFHMGGAYAVGFAFQLVFGYIATSTTFTIMPPVLILIAVLAAAANETAIRKVKHE